MQEAIKLKLAYEWKNIYRALHMQDAENEGKVTKKVFEAVIHDTKAFLTREELAYIAKKYVDPL